jgi:hypothetical protein
VTPGGDVVLIDAAVLATVGFVASRSRGSVELLEWAGQRDGLLWMADLVGANAFLILFIGGVITTSSGASTVLTGKEVAGGWLEAVRDFGWFVAFVCDFARVCLRSSGRVRAGEPRAVTVEHVTSRQSLSTPLRLAVALGPRHENGQSSSA